VGYAVKGPQEGGRDPIRTIGIVLAGGQGHRFWPKSSGARPKQFLKLAGEESLLQATVRRLGRLVARDDIYLVTVAALEALTREHLPGLSEANLLIEPMGRDTAAAVGYALMVIGRREADSVVVVLPSDHYVADEEAWTRVLSDACLAADSGHPTLIGIPPTRPETAYGYVTFVEDWPLPQATTKFHRVARFVEKPHLALAERLLAENRCLWNSGMFVWQVKTALTLLQRHLPDTFAILSEVARLGSGRGAPPVGSPAWRARAASLFAGITPVSVDYGVLEKTDGVLVALGDFGWDDLGGWESLTRLFPGDDAGNVVLGDSLLRDTEDCIVDWSGGPALVIGVKDLVIAGDGASLLVAARDRLGELKRLVSSPEFRAARRTRIGPGQPDDGPGKDGR